MTAPVHWPKYMDMDPLTEEFVRVKDLDGRGANDEPYEYGPRRVRTATKDDADTLGQQLYWRELQHGGTRPLRAGKARPTNLHIAMRDINAEAVDALADEIHEYHERPLHDQRRTRSDLGADEEDVPSVDKNADMIAAGLHHVAA